MELQINVLTECIMETQNGMGWKEPQRSSSSNLSAMGSDIFHWAWLLCMSMLNTSFCFGYDNAFLKTPYMMEIQATFACYLEVKNRSTSMCTHNSSFCFFFTSFFLLFLPYENGDYSSGSWGFPCWDNDIRNKIVKYAALRETSLCFLHPPSFLYSFSSIS